MEISKIFRLDAFFTYKIEQGLNVLFKKNEKIYQISRIGEIVLIAFLAKQSSPKSFGKGIVLGFGGFAYDIAAKAASFFGLKVLKPDYFNQAKGTSKAIKEPEPTSVSLRVENYIAPLIEEFFNLMIRETIAWGAYKILIASLNTQDIQPLEYQITARKIAIFTSSAIFVMRHSHYPGVAKLILLPKAFVYASMGFSEGIICPTVAHITNNMIYSLF